MSTRSTYLLAVGVGGTIGGFIPSLWGAGAFSMWGVVMSGVGGLAGIWLVHRYLV